MANTTFTIRRSSNGNQYSQFPNGDYSASVSAPINVIASVSNNDISVTWTNVGPTGTLSLERSASPISGWLVISTLPSGTAQFDDMNLANGSYYYRVRNIFGGNASAYSNVASASIGAIFFDDFTTGDLSKTMGGFTWGSSEQPSPNRLGVVGFKLQFEYNWVAGTNRTASWVEQKFNLGGYYTDVWFKFDMLIPGNYYHPRANDPAGFAPYQGENNKFFLLYDDDYYNPYFGQSIELYPHNTVNGQSKGALRGWSTHAPIDYNEGFGSFLNFITAADYGKTVTFYLHFKYASAANNDGVAEVWATRDGVTTKRGEKLNGAWYVPGAPGWNKGYILGYMNSCFQASSSAQNRIFTVDNFEFSASDVWGVSS